MIPQKRGNIPEANAALARRVLRARRTKELVVGITVDELDAICRDVQALLTVAESYRALTAKIADEAAEKKNRQLPRNAPDIDSWVLRA